jgi:hypothetical protein
MITIKIGKDEILLIDLTDKQNSILQDSKNTSS